MEVAQGTGHVQQQLEALADLGVRCVLYHVAVEVGALNALEDEQHLALHGLYASPVEENYVGVPYMTKDADLIRESDQAFGAGVLAVPRPLHGDGRAVKCPAHDEAERPGAEEIIGFQLQLFRVDEPMLHLAERVHLFQAFLQLINLVLRRPLQPTGDIHAVEDAARGGRLRHGGRQVQRHGVRCRRCAFPCTLGLHQHVPVLLPHVDLDVLQLLHALPARDPDADEKCRRLVLRAPGAVDTAVAHYEHVNRDLDTRLVHESRGQ
mmetsp:Transcript_96992/g.301916  ORF Transcript_96992/g.301916 Transcript_96992/m.301916 type:complete len:265 (+) Transcript_96992:211-1005(+)